ncbi:hypothetical protein KY285_031274 [Solanum tuberosum]|nr:hypothetical protein KY284_031069 [Solanum tuberosum]KAH0656392.1 hypothetical protein KY285_031274 [Solanum tuberosum]
MQNGAKHSAGSSHSDNTWHTWSVCNTDRMHNTELTPDRLSVIAYTYGPWYGPYVTSNDWAWLHSGRDCLFPQPLFSSGYSFRWSLVLPCYHVVNPFIPITLFAFEVATGSPVLELLS